MCNIGSCETPEFFAETERVARKTHTCCECGSRIDPGETYIVSRGVWDGVFQAFKTCSFCAAIRGKAPHLIGLESDEGIPFGELYECVGMDFAAGESS